MFFAGATTRLATSTPFKGFHLPFLKYPAKTHMESNSPPLTNGPHLKPSSASRSPPRMLINSVEGTKKNDGLMVTLEEWQGWGTVSPLPAKVVEVIKDLKLLEQNIDAQMSFGGNGGKLQGNFKLQEDKKHRATYQSLNDSEEKLQFFAARQIACRLLGSRGYLCQKCWLPLEEDCICSRVKHISLWHKIHFWLYMHPKDFLRQNNTGKLLWQIFGVQSATLCIFGISEMEKIMWNALKLAGKGKVWCLYPNKNAEQTSVQDAFYQELSVDLGFNEDTRREDETLNFILIDGTWSNSAAMFRRLKEQTNSIWGDDDLPCISLNTGVSTMHKLRPQPSWDRTCTAAAAIGLLSELQIHPEFSACGLDKQGEALEDALLVLLEALTKRRLRMGRSITRKVRHNINVC